MITDVQLLSTDDLLNELHNRFDAVLFFAMRKDSVDKNAWAWSSSGSRMLLLGMAEYLRSAVEKKVCDEDFMGEDPQ